MPLLLICPCGHSAPLPDASGRYACSQCKRVTALTWCEAPDALGQFARLERAALWAGAMRARARVEWRAGSEAR